jgi:hypothetical protein
MFDSRPKRNQPGIFLENIILVPGLVRHFIFFEIIKNSEKWLPTM